jgi:hypothetical protein
MPYAHSGLRNTDDTIALSIKKGDGAMTVKILLLAATLSLTSGYGGLKAQERKSANPASAHSPAQRSDPGQRLRNAQAKPTHDEIVNWMNEYFTEYNVSAQNAKTVHRMDTYFAPDFTFIPYMYVFGGPKSAIKGREAFYNMLTNHPADYEKFIVHDVFVDEKRLVSVAFLEATIFETGTNRIKVKKNYLPLYELMLDKTGALKIATIRFFWEALPPEVDGAAYSVDKSKWGSRR